MDTLAQSLSFDLKISKEHNVEFTQEATFENFAGQFQPYCTKLLCVIDGTSLRYYDTTGPLPINLRFDYKQRRGTLTEYYFRSIDTDTLYCVFGREMARIFYPRIDEVDPVYEPSLKSEREIQVTKRPPIIQPIKPQSIPLFRETILDSNQIKIITQSKVNPTPVPKNITIIDKGVKLTFPNPNYPVEVRTYYPS